MDNRTAIRLLSIHAEAMLVILNECDLKNGYASENIVYHEIKDRVVYIRTLLEERSKPLATKKKGKKKSAPRKKAVPRRSTPVENKDPVDGGEPEKEEPQSETTENIDHEFSDPDDDHLDDDDHSDGTDDDD